MERTFKRLDSLFNSSNAKTIVVLLLLAFIIAGYVFFFNSTKIFGENYDYEISQVGNVITLEDNHTVTLVRSDIDLTSNVIEYEFYFDNSNFDGKNGYEIQIKTTKRNGKISLLKTQTVCADSDVYVIRAALPKKWNAAVADIKLSSGEKTLEAKFYSTKDSLYPSSISGNTREDFLKIDTERNIERLNSEINNLNKAIAELETKISEIDEKIQTLQNRAEYMTADELEEARLSIESMKNERSSCIAEIDNNRKLISGYENDILNLKSKNQGKGD